jgi:hypothetical protein
MTVSVSVFVFVSVSVLSVAVLFCSAQSLKAERRRGLCSVCVMDNGARLRSLVKG